MTPVVVLGLMGAGKSTVAAAVAAATRRVLYDSDVDITAATGRTAARIATRSVEHLHRLEADHLLAALADPGAVVAAAASVVDDPACRAALDGGALVVWLDAPVEVLAARFDSGPHRPVYGRDTRRVLREQRARRADAFAAVADLRLDAGRPVDELVAQVVVATAAAGDRTTTAGSAT